MEGLKELIEEKFKELQEFFEEQVRNKVAGCLREADPSRLPKVQVPVDASEENAGLTSTAITSVNRPPSCSSTKLNSMFDGRESWRAYKQHFFTVAKLNQWNNEQMGLQLACALNGDALLVQSSLVVEEQCSFDSLVRVLDRKYDSICSHAARAALYTAAQGTGESAIDFSHRLRLMVRDAHPDLCGDTCEDILVEQFCRGVRERSLGHALLLQRPKTLDEAVDLMGISGGLQPTSGTESSVSANMLGEIRADLDHLKRASRNAGNFVDQECVPLLRSVRSLKAGMSEAVDPAEERWDEQSPSVKQERDDEAAKSMVLSGGLQPTSGTESSVSANMLGEIRADLDHLKRASRNAGNFGDQACVPLLRSVRSLEAGMSEAVDPAEERWDEQSPSVKLERVDEAAKSSIHGFVAKSDSKCFVSPLILSCTVLDVAFNFFIDTGSSATVINRASVYDRISDRSGNLDVYEGQRLSVMGNPITCHGELDFRKLNAVTVKDSYPLPFT
ncbi:uncharacterized protein LOC144748335 [Ciona intestinalis]